MEIGILIMQALYFMLPAYAANMAPLIFKNHFRSLARPVAHGVTLRGRPLFGRNKTFRGIIAATAAGILVFSVQVFLFRHSFFQIISIFDYSLMFQRHYLLIGFLLGFGAIIGDLIESMVKRQLDRPPGSRFMPWDQIDFVIGALLFTSIVYIPSWKAMLIIFLITPLGHIGMNHLAYYLKIKKVKW